MLLAVPTSKTSLGHKRYVASCIVVVMCPLTVNTVAEGPPSVGETTIMDLPQGYFNMGRSLDYGDLHHNRLLVSVCNYMGLNDQTFGNLDDGTGPLDGLA